MEQVPEVAKPLWLKKLWRTFLAFCADVRRTPGRYWMMRDIEKMMPHLRAWTTNSMFTELQKGIRSWEGRQALLAVAAVVEMRKLSPVELDELLSQAKEWNDQRTSTSAGSSSAES
jgi:hypothetical protein